MVRHRQDANAIFDDHVDHAERKAPHDETALAVVPEGAELRGPHQQPNRVFEL
jgi:hypothetical protein